jgi:hypothetical protein
MKRSLFTSAFALAISLCNAGELPVVKAIGGDGTNVNWAAIKIAEESDPDGPGYFYQDCAQGVQPVKASSTLADQGGKSYGISNLSDYDPMTAWVEGVKGYGIGEWFDVKAGGVNTIYNGYQSTPQAWKNNSRVKRFKVYMNDTAVCYLDLTDEMGKQRFDLDVRQASYDHPITFRFEIVEVYKGDKWDDVAISHVDEMACCYSSGTLIAAVNGSIVAESIAKGSSVLYYDMVTDSVNPATVTLNAQQQHVTLLRVTAGSRTIEITPDHPLYMEGSGFTTLKNLKTAPGDSGYTSLAGNYKVLMWDEVKQTSFYATVGRIEVLHGLFNTVTIRGMNIGSMYIANGFISKTY